MSGVILRGEALKLVNRPGGYVTKTVVEEHEDALGKKKKTHKHMISREKVRGSDYVVFNCPGCNKRNKRCIYEAKGRAGNSLSFKCNQCYREIEVAPPAPQNKIIRPGLVDPNGRVIG
jgi:hypothetical protein